MNGTEEQTWTVTQSPEWRDEGTFLGVTRRGWAARVELNGIDFHVSRLEDSPHWGVDAAFGDNGYPHWCHSFGERAGLAVKCLPEGIAAELDALL